MRTTWNVTYEYPTAVDGSGYPTAWATLTPSSDTTANGTRRFVQSGTIHFDPPSNWVSAKVPGGDPYRYFLIRIKTATTGTAVPGVTALTTANYIGGSGGPSSPWVVPAFDYTVDTNHDGYLSDAEYANTSRDPSKTARFVYQSREFTNYGQTRYLTNPADQTFANWAVSFAAHLKTEYGEADGLFDDNSESTVDLPAGAQLLEPDPSTTYSADYGKLLGRIDTEVFGSYEVLPNVTEDTNAAHAQTTVTKTRSYYSEFALKPEQQSYQLFETVANEVANRASTEAPWDGVLDSRSNATGQTAGTSTRQDTRVLEAVLAYYYLVADPDTNLLDLFGGEAPSSSWDEHWTDMIPYDVGKPQGFRSIFTAGTEPGNGGNTYQVYQRAYTRFNSDSTTTDALVLFKPLSMNSSGGTSTYVDATHTATTPITLPGTYHRLQSDGFTLGPAITSISLMDGEGAILIKDDGDEMGMMMPQELTAGSPLAQGAAEPASAYAIAPQEADIAREGQLPDAVFLPQQGASSHAGLESSIAASGASPPRYVLLALLASGGIGGEVSTAFTPRSEADAGTATKTWSAPTDTPRPSEQGTDAWQSMKAEPASDALETSDEAPAIGKDDVFLTSGRLF